MMVVICLTIQFTWVIKNCSKEIMSNSLVICIFGLPYFDPAVLADDKGNAYVYFGGGNDEEKYVQTGRVCKLKFEKGTGKVSSDGVPQILDTFCFFEDGEINQIDGKYMLQSVLHLHMVYLSLHPSLYNKNRYICRQSG